MWTSATEDTADAVSGVEACLLCRIWALEERLTALQEDITALCMPLPLLPPSATQLSPALATSTSGPVGCQQDQEMPITMLVESLGPLQNIFFHGNIAQTGRQQGDFVVSQEAVATVLQACRSRQNMVAH